MIKNKIHKKLITLKKSFNLKCFHIDAINIIKSMITFINHHNEKYNNKIKIVLVSPPKYSIIIDTYDENVGNSYLNELFELIKNHMTVLNCIIE